MSNLQLVNIGSAPNDGRGDSLRIAFQKINENFQAVYSRTAVGHSLRVDGNVIKPMPVSNITTPEGSGNGNIELEVSANGLIQLRGNSIIEGSLVQLGNVNSNIKIQNDSVEISGRASFKDTMQIPQFSNDFDTKGKPDDVPGMMFCDSNYIYICVGSYDGSSAIWKRASLIDWI